MKATQHPRIEQDRLERERDGTFHKVSQVHPISPGRYRASIAPGWDVLGNTDGGYLLAVAARALAQETGRAPVSVTAHYLAPVSHGTVLMDTQVIKQGKGLSTGTATLRFEDRPALIVVGSFGALDDDAEVLMQDAEPVRLPEPPQASPRMLPLAGQPLPPAFSEKVDIRLHPEDIGFMRGKPGGTARMRGWFRLGEGQDWDPFALLLAADSFPPTVFNTGLPINWTPTVELTAHLRALPQTEFVKMEYRTRFIGNGRLEVDGLIWDQSDRLCAQSRQLALVPRG